MKINTNSKHTLLRLLTPALLALLVGCGGGSGSSTDSTTGEQTDDVNQSEQVKDDQNDSNEFESIDDDNDFDDGNQAKDEDNSTVDDQNQDDDFSDDEEENDEQSNTDSDTPSVEPYAKNIILMIGDGMGYAQIEATRRYTGKDIVFESFPYEGEVITSSMSEELGHEEYTDSAAAATAYATGNKVCNGVVSKRSNSDCNGTHGNLETLVEFFKEEGRSTGVVTNVAMTHATPAAFSSHSDSRHDTATVKEALFQVKPNIVMGASTYKSVTVTSSDANQHGYDVATTKTKLDSLVKNASEGDFIMGIFDSNKDNNALPRELNEKSEYSSRDLPHLKDMAAAAVKVLSKDKDGYFLMIEGGIIDWGGHANELDTVVAETEAFNEAVKSVYDLVKDDPNTILIVTADHETGGLKLDAGTNGDGYPNHTWRWTNHTNVNVPVFAWGKAAAEINDEELDNTELHELMLAVSRKPVVEDKDDDTTDSDNSDGDNNQTPEVTCPSNEMYVRSGTNGWTANADSAMACEAGIWIKEYRFNGSEEQGLDFKLTNFTGTDWSVGDHYGQTNGQAAKGDDANNFSVDQSGAKYRIEFDEKSVDVTITKVDDPK